MPIFQTIVDNNYLLALIIFVVISAIFLLLQKFLLKKLETLSATSDNKIDDLIAIVIKSIKPITYYSIALYIPVKILFHFGDKLSSVVDSAFFLIIAIQIVLSINISITFVIDQFIEKRKGGNTGLASAIHTVGTLVRAIVWIIGILLVLSSFGINVTALAAGLGIGGLAFAFAFQKILADLFGAFVILIDRPFSVGDSVIVGQHSGVVEKIGLKSTRIRSFRGEEITIPNETLTNSQIQNLRRIKERRSIINIGVLYETDRAKLKAIPKLLEGIITKEENTRFGRAHLTQFGDSALVFELVYYILSKDFDEYRKREQDILFHIVDAFDREGIEFAYPTQTLFVKK